MASNRKSTPSKSPSAALRSARLSLRASQEQEQLIRQAAAAAHKNVTEFVLDSACSAAQQVLSDRRVFLLDEAQWQRFLEALDRPVSEKPRLKALLSAPSAVDRS